MTTPTMDALDIIRKRAGEADVDFLRETLQVVLHAVMDADVSQRIGAGLHERTPDRTDYRNGYRPRRWDTRAGTIDLRIPKLRQGSYLPAFLEPRRRSEQALLAVIQQAHVEGVSTRRVEDLVQALGCAGISKSEVSRICQQLDQQVQAFRERHRDRLRAGLALRQRRQLPADVQVLGADETVVRVRGQAQLIGFVVDAASGQTLGVDMLVESVAGWYAQALGVEVLVTDDLATYKPVSLQLGLRHQVCLTHVRKWFGHRLR